MLPVLQGGRLVGEIGWSVAWQVERRPIHNVANLRFDGRRRVGLHGWTHAVDDSS